MSAMALQGGCDLQAEGRKKEGETQGMGQAEAEGVVEQRGACLASLPSPPAWTRVGCQQPRAGMLQGAFLGDIQNGFE